MASKFFSRSSRKASSHDEGDAPTARPVAMSESMPNLNNDQFEIVDRKLPYSYEEDGPQDSKTAASVQQQDPSPLSPPHHLRGGTSVQVDSPISSTSMNANDVPDSILQDLPSSDAEDAAALPRVAVTPPRLHSRKHAASAIQVETVVGDSDDEEEEGDGLAPSLLKMASKKQSATKRHADPRSETEAASVEDHSPDPKKARTTTKATFHNTSDGVLQQPMLPIAAETPRTTQLAINNNQPPQGPAPSNPPVALPTDQADASPNNGVNKPCFFSTYSKAVLLVICIFGSMKLAGYFDEPTKTPTTAAPTVTKSNSSIVTGDPLELVKTEVIETVPPTEVIDTSTNVIVVTVDYGEFDEIIDLDKLDQNNKTTVGNVENDMVPVPEQESVPSKAPVLEILASGVLSTTGSAVDAISTKFWSPPVEKISDPPVEDLPPIEDPTEKEEPTEKKEEPTPSPTHDGGLCPGMGSIVARCVAMLFLGMMLPSVFTKKPDDNQSVVSDITVEENPDMNNKVDELCNFLRMCNNALSRTGRCSRANPTASMRMGYNVTAYEALTKEELHNIGSQLGVPRLNASDNKATLIQKIVPAYEAMLQGFVVPEIKQVLAAKNVTPTWNQKKADLVKLAVEAAF